MERKNPGRATCSSGQTEIKGEEAESQDREVYQKVHLNLGPDADGISSTAYNGVLVGSSPTRLIMIEFFVKTILILFLLFYVVDFVLFYIEIDFPLKTRYQKTKIYKLMRRMGFWGRLNMFCPGSRIVYYHYKLVVNDEVIFEFPDYTKLPYHKQLLYYRWRKPGYAGLRQRKKAFLKYACIQYGFRHGKVIERQMIMPTMKANNKITKMREKYSTITYPDYEEVDGNDS